MNTINLFATNEQVELKKFAGGECHLRFTGIFTEADAVRLNTRLNTSDDVMTLCLAVDALRNMGVRHIEAFIPYLPYARQDRVMMPGEPLSAKVIASMINALQLNRVLVFDAHSDVSVALLNNCRNISNAAMVIFFLEELRLKDYVLVSPDLGAYKKANLLARQTGYTGSIATGLKVRDLATGHILKSEVICNGLEGRPCLVVDDICDGGRTFTELAAALKEKQAGDLHLIVSHGIFSHNALHKLREAGYKSVSGSNSIADRPEDGFYKQFNLF